MSTETQKVLIHLKSISAHYLSSDVMEPTSMKEVCLPRFLFIDDAGIVLRLPPIPTNPDVSKPGGPRSRRTVCSGIGPKGDRAKGERGDRRKDECIEMLVSTVGRWRGPCG